jgi:hypothetical protein
MDSKEKLKRLERLRGDMNEAAVRIRRYTVDPRLVFTNEAPGKLSRDTIEQVRADAEAVWGRWLGVHVEVEKLPSDPSDDALIDLEKKHLQIDHEIDLVQRELIGEDVFLAGRRTVTWLVLAMAATVAAYVGLHIAHPPDFASWDFEPWSEWGPLKYGEVMFWGMFGCLCYLLITAATYLLRRDFDRWYQTWYVAVFLRSPFMTLILMMIVLEFVEWYGEDTSWIHDYILEEGNKFYFIVFMSFCLGLASNTAASIMRDLSNGVCEMVSRAVSKVSSKLGSAVSDTSTPTKH